MGGWMSRGRRRSDRRRGASIPLLSMVAVAAVIAPPVLTQTYPVAGTAGVARDGVLTPDGSDSYTYEGSLGAVEARALASDNSVNLRTLFWPVKRLGGLPNNQQSCATFSSASSWMAQQGVALRIRRTPVGGVTGITVTKNIWFGATWIFNVHAWDGTPTLHPLASFNLESVFLDPDGAPRPFPWTLCARIIGAQITVKGWLTGSAEPEWGDENFGGTSTLAVDPAVRGLAGWYIGHLPPGGSAEFTDLRTWSIAPGTAPAPSTTLSMFGSSPPSGPGASVTVRGPAVASPDADGGPVSPATGPVA